jgi:hypothetical protein
MFGNVVTRKGLKQLIDRHVLDIAGFDTKIMRQIHYPVTGARVYTRGNMGIDHTIDVKFRGEINSKERVVFEPNEYLIIELKERIEMREPGIIGHFVAASHFIEKGLGLVAGRIETPYGKKSEVLRVGVKNLLGIPNFLHHDDKIAYIYFFDILGLLDDESYKMTAREWKQFEQWRIYKENIADSGVTFDADHEPH